MFVSSCLSDFRLRIAIKFHIRQRTISACCLHQEGGSTTDVASDNIVSAAVPRLQVFMHSGFKLYAIRVLRIAQPPVRADLAAVICRVNCPTARTVNYNIKFWDYD